MATPHSSPSATLVKVLNRIEQRSKDLRSKYEDRMQQQAAKGTQRGRLSCTNLAHAYAAAPSNDKLKLVEERAPNLAIVSAYNDMLSAHQPLLHFPPLIMRGAAQAGATAQFAGGVPAMCDGVTQGQPGMELSLFSRDVIAQSTAIALSHAVFDRTAALGVCDKIVPGLLMGALTCGHLPTLFVPAGPMTTGAPNKEKARIRQLFAEGKVGRDALMDMEMKSYHGPGTCTFYGTANSNQMLMEFMGLHLPGAAFINPGTELREALTVRAGQHLAKLDTPLWKIVDAKSIINAIVGLHATGGSTNHTIHLIAIARCAGLIIDWDDFAELSAATPLLVRAYPNGDADVNQFHAAGGLGFVIRELLSAGCLFNDVNTVMGTGLDAYTQEPKLIDGELTWQDAPAESLDDNVVRPYNSAFDAEGGLKLMQGNIGRAVVKTSAVNSEHQIITAPAKVFHTQTALKDAFDAGELEQDFIAVVRFQGPGVNGMPELHKLTPYLGALQDRGFKVALVTDGRMSGASGKVPAAIHVSPEANQGGNIGKINDGDMIELNCKTGVLRVVVDEETLQQRPMASADLDDYQQGLGRELFGAMRRSVTAAEEGAIALF